MNAAPTVPEKKPRTKRIVAIDRFRGLIVFCMMFFICAAEFPCLGVISRFANNSGTGTFMLFSEMSFADLVDPIFLFLISLSYQHSFDRRFTSVGNKAYLHFLIRYLCFMGVGSIIVSAEYVFVRHTSDPFFIQTFLMFAVIVFFVASLAVRPFRKLPAAVGKYIKAALTASLVILGFIGIVLGTRDDIIIFFGLGGELYKHWSILHEIGMTGLLVLPFIRLKLPAKIAVWFAFGAVYTCAQTLPDVIRKFDIVVLGGLIGTTGWFLLMFGGVIMMNLYGLDKFHLWYLAGVAVTALLSFVSIKFLPMNTSAVTANYVVFSLTVAAALFRLINLLDTWQPKIQYFAWWGRNPLPLFLMGLIFRGIQLIWDPSPDTSLPVALAFTVGGIGILSWIAYYLYKKDIILKF